MCAYWLCEQGESPKALQKLLAAPLVEVQSREGVVGLLQFADQKGPTFLPHSDGPELADTEGQRPPAPVVAVVWKAWKKKAGCCWRDLLNWLLTVVYCGLLSITV